MASNGRWIGSIVVGINERGWPQRCTVSAVTRREAVAKLTKLHCDVGDDLEVKIHGVTLEQLIVKWYEDVLGHQVQEAAALNYLSIEENYVLPTLGKKRLRDLTPVHVEHLLAKKLKSNLAPTVARR